jgi:hypothetical protein
MTNLALPELGSDWELNTKDVENSLSFPAAIYTTSNDPWFGNYEFWDVTDAAGILLWTE